LARVIERGAARLDDEGSPGASFEFAQVVILQQSIDGRELAKLIVFHLAIF
jgi:hypothetical protein